MKRVFLAVVLLSLFVGTASQVFAAQPQTQEKFYDGKVITMIVPYRPGSGSDTYARMMMSYLQQAIPNVSVGIKNRPEGGGMVAINDFYNVVKPDGLSILIAPTGKWTEAMLGDPNVKHDIDQFQYLGGVVGGEFAITVASTGKYTTVDALRKGKGVKFGSSSPNALPGLATVGAIEVLGLDAKVISGYEGSAPRTLALVQGEIDAMLASVEVAEGYKKSGMKTQTLVVVSPTRSENFPNVPCVADFMKLSDYQQLLMKAIYQEARAWSVPPGTPADRVQYLRDIFSKILKSKEFVQTAKGFAGDEWMGIWTGDVIQKQAVELQKTSKELAKIYKELIKKYVQ